MPDKVRIGLVGSAPPGSWSRTAHVPALQSLPEIELAAICTTREESAREAAATFGIPHAFADVAEMARRPDIDAVAVVVRVPNHYGPVMAALEAGKHVFCEWPLGQTTAQAEEMLQAARRKNVVHMVGLQARVSPVINYIKDLVAQGFVGRVLSATILSSRSGHGDRIPQSRVWSEDRRAGINALTNGHTVDTLRYCCGDFAEVSALLATRFPEPTVIETGEKITKTSPDQVAIVGTLSSGAVATAHMRNGTFRGSGSFFEINGTEGDLILASPDSEGIQFAKSVLRGAQRKNGESSGLVELAVPDGYTWVPPSVPSGAPFNVAQGYARFARTIRSGTTEIAPDFAVAVDMHHLIDAIQQSSDSGRRVTQA
jgi:predicted dehydrogenase